MVKTKIMKKLSFLKITSSMFVCLMILLSACTKEIEDEPLLNGTPENENFLRSGQNGADMYIVVLNDDFEAATELNQTKGYDNRKEVMTGYLNRYLNGKGIQKEQVEHVYTNVYLGFSVKLSGPQLQRLEQDPRVKSIERDQAIVLGKPIKDPPPPPPQPDQIVSWGTTRVGGPIDGTGKRAWVIDSGIDFECPDLNVDKVNSRCFVPKTRKTFLSPDDKYGHGTACAGHIAAINNDIGAVGVAAGASVIAVRVLNDNGAGMSSWFLAGADYVASVAQPGDVVNISLRYPASDDIDNAVIAIGALGIRVAKSAGNDALPTYLSPGRAVGANLYTVAAFAEGDIWASFSNYGDAVDYCAPGFNVYTCWLDGTYVYGGGTSAAAPHVAGLLLLGDVNSDGYVTCPYDGKEYPIAHR
jgi:subtilisin family serine protease